MGNCNLKAISKGKPQLSPFQKKKLLFEYHLFFDRNKDGTLTEKDLHLARKEICEMNHWLPGSVQFETTKELFEGIWGALMENADEDADSNISTDEWIGMWQKFHEAVQANREDKFPSWVKAYLWYRFQLLDRDRNGVVDEEEFCYVMSNFGISERSCKACYKMFTINDTKKLDYEYFRKLAAQYYRSDDCASLGNFITGKLDWFE